MKRNPLMFHVKQTGLLLLSFLLFTTISSQIKTRTTSNRALATGARIMDTTPLRRAILNKEILVNPNLGKAFGVNTTTDTVWNLAPYLKSKENCDFEKSVDTNGCIIIKYKDGLIKKVCHGSVTEVITPDNKKHVAKFAGSTIYMYVMKLPPPPNPEESENSFKWLSQYSDGLMSDIKTALGDNKDLIQQYLAKETEKCNNSIYKQIEYRTIFLEEFLKAK